MHIWKKDLVLEIGSGNNPNPRSDILCDRYIHDNNQRAGEFAAVIDRPMVVADGYRLPFKDKAFDYVICSHILEHMEDPAAFLKEVTRVARAGYIEVPSALSERVFGWDFHLWYCSLKEGRLILKKKTEGERFGGFFHRLIANQVWFRRFFEEHEDAWYIKYEWKDQVKLFVDHKVPKEMYIKKLEDDAWKLLQQAKPHLIDDSIFYLQWMGRRLLRKMKKIIRKTIWRLSIQPMSALLVCPTCTSDTLMKSENTLVCRHCNHSFPLLGSIPVMLSHAERKRGY